MIYLLSHAEVWNYCNVPQLGEGGMARLFPLLQNGEIDLE